MTLLKGQRLCSMGSQQPFFIQATESVDTLSISSNQRSGQQRNFTKDFTKASLVAGVVTVAVGAAAPAYASTEVSQTFLDEQTQYGQIQYGQVGSSQSSVSQAQNEQFQREQARIDKLRRLQAGVSPERRLQAETLRASQYEQAQYEQAQYEPPRYENHQYEQPVSYEQPAPVQPADGVYLYGQQPVPNQLATAYFVFEAQGGAVTGAFYMPSSSFDCVQGRIDNQQMALNVTDSYSQETTSYALTLEAPNAQLASFDSVVATPPNISGYHSLPVSDRDRDLLATCQARY